MNANNFLQVISPSYVLRAIKTAGVLNILKYGEIRLLRKFATSYCFGKPDTVYLESTNRCNLSCKFCYRFNDRLMNENVGVMSFENFKTVADNLRGIRRLYLSWGGEPLLNKDIVAMARYISENRIVDNFGFVTNGMLLTSPISEELIKAGLGFLTISIDGGDAKTHEFYRSGSDFEKIVSNVHEFSKQKQRHAGQTRIEIASVLTKDNEQSLRAIPEIFSSARISKWTVQDVVPRTDKSKSWKPGATTAFDAEMKTLCKKRNIFFRHYHFYPIDICIQPFRVQGISWDGKASPCCNIFSLGINKEPYNIHGVWNCSEMREWRKKMLKRHYPALCQSHCNIIGYNQPFA